VGGGRAGRTGWSASEPDEPATPPGGGSVLRNVAWLDNASAGRTVAGQSLAQPGQRHPGARVREVAGDIDGRVGGAVDLFSFHIQFERSVPGTLAGGVLGQEGKRGGIGGPRDTNEPLGTKPRR